MAHICQGQSTFNQCFPDLNLVVKIDLAGIARLCTLYFCHLIITTNKHDCSAYRIMVTYLKCSARSGFSPVHSAFGSIKMGLFMAGKSMRGCGFVATGFPHCVANVQTFSICQVERKHCYDSKHCCAIDCRNGFRKKSGISFYRLSECRLWKLNM